MARYTSTLPKRATALKASSTPNTVTGNGAAAYTYEDKSALFLLGVGNFVGQTAFYENASARDLRFVELVRRNASADPEWTANFLTWLRTKGNIRTAAIIGAVEYGRTVAGSVNPVAPNLAKFKNTKDYEAAFEKFLTEQATTPRAVLASVLQRADEPSEALGYWLTTYGKPLPQWFKRALNDAANRLYTEKSVFKYDQQSAKVRFSDVIQVSQASAATPYKDQVFRWALERRYVSDADYAVNLGPNLASLSVLDNRLALKGLPDDDLHRALRNPDVLDSAGLTWESAASLYGTLDAAFWEAQIPNLGYMALLRNLVNFAKAEISSATWTSVLARISDPEEVAKSKQLPFRFYSASRQVDEQRNGFGTQYVKVQKALGIALDHSLANVPELPGTTAIMIDISGSMMDTQSAKSNISRADHAHLFGLALALRNPQARVFQYDDQVTEIKPMYTATVLENVSWFSKTRGGTQTVNCAETVAQIVGKLDRLIILTDEQTSPFQVIDSWYYGTSNKSLRQVVPSGTSLITYNLGGYEASQAPMGEQDTYSVGGLSDAGFALLGAISTAKSGKWPWDL